MKAYYQHQSVTSVIFCFISLIIISHKDYTVKVSCQTSLKRDVAIMKRFYILTNSAEVFGHERSTMETWNNSSDYGNIITDPLAAYPKIKLMRTLLYSLMAVLGVALNVVTIITMRKGENFKKKGIQVLLTNKSIADLLTSMTFPLVYAVLPYWPFATTVTPFIVATIASFAIYTSLLWNSVLSVERFVAVYFPLRTLSKRKRDKIITSVFVWFVGFTAAVTLALMTIADCNNGSLLDLRATGTCALMFWFDRHNEDLMAFAVIPCLLMLVMYCLVTSKVYCCREMTQSIQLSDAGRQKYQKIQKRVTVMLMVDALVSLMTWVPWRLILSEQFICGSSIMTQYHTVRFTFMYVIWMSNCFTTPIIYYTLNKSFRVSLFYH